MKTEKNIDEMLYYITGKDKNTDLKNIDYQKEVEKYLKSIGMDEQDLKDLKNKLLK